MKKIFCSVIAFTAFSGMANAADLMASTAYDWSGPYVGLTAGVADHKADWTDLADDWFSGTETFGSTSGLVGAYAGYNYDLGSIVLGVEGDFAVAFNDDKGTGPTYDEIYSNDLNWLGSLRGRIGVPVDRVLIYGTGGLALAGVTNEMTSVTYPTEDFENTKDTVLGFVVGAGVEYAVSDTVNLRLEGLYYDFKDDTYAQEQDPDQFMKIKNTVVVGRVGISYRF